jgi:PAS domain S-box-containing protein
MIENGRFQLVAIGEMRGPDQRVAFLASAGPCIGYLDAAGAFAADFPCLRKDRSDVSNDMAADPRFAPVRALHQRFGLRSEAACPIHFRGEVWGALSVYSAETGSFGPQEVSLLEDLASDISFALEAVEIDAERKRCADALAESELLFSNAFQHAPTGMALVGLDGNWLSVNSAMCTLLGYSQQELLATTFRKLSFPDDLPFDLEQRRRMQLGEIDLHRMEKRYVHKAGHIVWVLLSLSLMRAVNGQPLYFIAQLSDITESKVAIEALRASEERYRKLVGNIPDGVVVALGRNLRINFIGGADAKALSLSLEAFQGKNINEVLPPETWTVVEPFFQQVLQGRTVAYEAPYRDQLHYHITAAPLFQAEGFVEEIVVVSRNITERKRAEDALKRSEQQLRLLSARLETLREEERTRISREIHDELGQMLSGIKMNLRAAEKLLDVFGDDRRVNPVLDKLVETDELTDATLTNIQRIASELRPGILDNLGLATAIRNESNQFADRTGIRCHSTIPENFPTVPTDIATGLFRIFQEALTNVARHADATSVEVALWVHEHAFHLEIRDNGKGITTADLVQPGSLGLLGMRERARMLGGAVEFNRSADGGTVVAVQLPINHVKREKG